MKKANYIKFCYEDDKYSRYERMLEDIKEFINKIGKDNFIAMYVYEIENYYNGSIVIWYWEE